MRKQKIKPVAREVRHSNSQCLHGNSERSSLVTFLLKKHLHNLHVTYLDNLHISVRHVRG